MASEHAPGTNRLPPQSLEAERSVIGSMLRDNAVITVLTMLIRTDDFYADGHQKIFDAIVTLHDKGGQPVDVVILAEELKQRGQIEDVGGYPALYDLWDAAPTAANAEYYAKIVREKALVRGLIHASTEILRDAYDQVMPPDQLIEGAERKILDVAEKGITGQTWTLEQAILDTYDRIDKRQTGDQMQFSGLSTGFADLNEITAGLQKSEMIIVAARPSVGKTAFALGLTRNVIVEEKEPVLFVSLEQSRLELAERMLCSQARVDSHRLRKGTMTSEDMEKLIQAGDILRNAKLFIDDSPTQSMLRISANARRLRHRQGIKLVVIDYLQLIEPDNRRDPRQEQVAQISRRIKALARELEVPVIALAQVNRSSEDRQDHRPRLSDLRESGCLAGDTLITMADTGARVPIRDLVGKSGFAVWALDEVSMKLKPAEVSHAFSTGRKPVYVLETRLGRRIRATGNHKFRAFNGWRRLDELKVKDLVALPRVVPCSDRPATLTRPQAALLGHLLGDGCTLPRHCLQYTTREEDLGQTVMTLAGEAFGGRVRPRMQWEQEGWYQVFLPSTEHLTHGRRNPVAEWLDGLGAFGFRAWEKRVPRIVFEQSAELIATFLRHQWATDGCIRPPQGKTRHPAVYYASSSEGMARDVQSLLLRLGINGVMRPRDQGTKGRTQFHVLVMGHDDILAFANCGTVGEYKSTSLEQCCAWIAVRAANTNRDVIPKDIWREYVVPAMRRNGVTMRQMQKALGMSFCGTALYKQNVSRDRLRRVVSAVGGEETLAALAQSDVYWDQVRSIRPDGEEEVFDLTVPGPANFLADDIIVHNSIEQDADTVLLLHRPDRYEPGQHEGVIEVIVAKQRNGPTGEVTLAYIKQYMRYEDFQVGTPFDG